MVLQFIPVAVRIGQIVYRIATASNKFPKTTQVLKQQGALSGAQHGAGLGAFVANVEYYYEQASEQAGNIIGLPEKIQQRTGYRQQKARNKVFCPPRSRRFRKRNYYRASRR